MGTWIDFKTLREQLRFADVLRHYGVEVKLKGDQHLGYCPLPTHNGTRNSPSFSANLTKGIFNCFGCGAKGNVIDFATLMEGMNPDNGSDVRSAAIKLQAKFGTPAGQAKKTEKRHVAPQFELSHAKEEPQAAKTVVNASLDFELKNLDANHPYLDKRGFTEETIHHFGLGFCSKGLLSGRIAIPIHGPEGKLTGYAGRIVDDTRINDENPRYKFPPKRKHNGVIYEFHKKELVYNAHRIQKPVDELLIVEGFPSVWWLTQMGFPFTVALMGWAMSKKQAEIIVDLIAPGGRAWVISDGDESGNKCAAGAFAHIAPRRSLRWLKLDEAKQPTDYPGGWYRARLGK